MPRPLYRDATPGSLNELASNVESDCSLGEQTVAAVGTWNWLNAIYHRGYYLPEDEVPTPATDRVTTFEGNPAQRAALYVATSLERFYEEKCKRLASGRLVWSQQPTESEKAEKLRAARELEQAETDQAGAHRRGGCPSRSHTTQRTSRPH